MNLNGCSGFGHSVNKPRTYYSRTQTTFGHGGEKFKFDLGAPNRLGNQDVNLLAGQQNIEQSECYGSEAKMAIRAQTSGT